ncbi:unnamed protein product, partial [Ectocarpus sp. 12 AP-2014]
MSTAEGALGELPPPPIQQGGLTDGSDVDEIITVEESAVGLQALPVTPVGGGGGGGNNASAPIDASTTTTAPDGTIRTRLGPRQHKQQAIPLGGALCCGGGSSADGSCCGPVEGIAVGRKFPFLGDVESTWANVEETIRNEVGGAYPLRRNNRQKLFRCKDEHEKSLPNRWSTVRIECAQAGTPARSPLSDDCKRRRNTSSKKINCNWKVLCQWPQRTAGPYITQVHLRHDTTPEGGMSDGNEHPPPRVFGDELSKEEIQQQELKIKELVEAGFGTTELHKYLQRDGKRLGEQGKQKVRNLRRKYQEAKPPANACLSSQTPSVVAPPETPRHIQPLPPPPPPLPPPLPPRESSAEPFGLGASPSLLLAASSPSAFVRDSPHGVRASST